MRFMLIERDGHTIRTERFDTLDAAHDEMEKKYCSHIPDDNPNGKFVGSCNMTEADLRIDKDTHFSWEIVQLD